MASESIVVYCCLMLLLMFPVSILIVMFYAEPGTPWHSYITLVLGYYSAYSIMLLVPIDIGSVVMARRSTAVGSDSVYNDDKLVLVTLYNVFFTSVLILGSVVLGFQEYYNTDGYFTLGGKLSSAFKRMAFDTFVPLIAGVIILGILIGQNVVSSNADALKLAAVVVTNTVYELGLMFLLGYALVEYPRMLWNMGDLRNYLLKTQTKAASEFKAIQDHQLSVSLVVSDVLKTRTALAGYADPKLVEAMDILISECPPEFRSDRMGKVATNKQGQVTIDTLANLRTRLNVEKDLYKMSQEKVEGTKMLAYRLEDIVASLDNPSATVIHWSLLNKDSTEWDYQYETKWKPLGYRIAAVVAGVLSLLSFLGVVCSMQGVNNDVSPYFLAVHADSSTIGGITVFILFTFGYTVYIATWAIFQIRTGASSELVPGRTTPEALSFNVRMVARLAAPLAFFYLGWISENGIRTGDWNYNEAPQQNVTVSVSTFDPLTNITTFSNTTMLTDDEIFMPSSFSKFYALQSIGAVQEVFGTVFPIVLFCVMGLVALNIFNRLLLCCKLGAYQFGAEIVTEEVLREGKRQLQRHRKGAERKFRRGELRSFLMNLGSNDDDAAAPNTCWRRMLSLVLGDPGVAQNETTARAEERLAQITEPAALQGVLERKAGGFSLGVGSGWREIYGEVKSPGFLHLYKDRKTFDTYNSSNSNPNSQRDPSYSTDLQNVTVMDLRLVQRFSPGGQTSASGTSGNSAELDIVLADETVRLRFKNADEAERWKQGLSAWKDFCADYGNLYPFGLPRSMGGSAVGGGSAGADVETGGRPSTSASGANAYRASAQSTDLSQIQVQDDDDDDDDEAAKKGGLLTSAGFRKSDGSSSLFSFGKKKGAGAVSAAPPKDDKPPSLEGWLEKKGHGRMHLSAGGDWSKRFLRVDESTGMLVYSKSSDPREKPQGEIDLRVVRDVTPYEKSGGKKDADYSRFNIDTGDRVYKFRAPNETEGQHWIETLNAWRDHFLLNM